MDDLARGWAILWGEDHGRLAGVAAVMIAVLASVAISLGVAVLTVVRRRRRKDDSESTLRPKRRAPLPGPDRGFRR